MPIESAPKDGTLVLLAKENDPKWPMRCRWWQGTHWRGWDCEDATHWQPLPAPPGSIEVKAESMAARPADQLNLPYRLRYAGATLKGEIGHLMMAAADALDRSRAASAIGDGGEPTAWADLPSGVTSRVARKAFERFQHHAEFPGSASAMREAIELADWMRRSEGAEVVPVPRDDLRQLLDAIESHWNAEMAAGRKRWNEESLMAKWIISLRVALAASAPNREE